MLRSEWVICESSDDENRFCTGTRYFVDSDGDVSDNEGDYWFLDEDLGGGRFASSALDTVFILEEGPMVVGNVDVVANNKNYVGKKINLIKRIREATGMGLKEAKDIADQLPTDSVGYVGVTITNSIKDKVAFDDVFSYASDEDNKEILQDLEGIVMKAVKAKQYTISKRIIGILEEFGN